MGPGSATRWGVGARVRSLEASQNFISKAFPCADRDFWRFGGHMGRWGVSSAWHSLMGPVPCDSGAQGMALSHWRISALPHPPPPTAPNLRVRPRRVVIVLSQMIIVGEGSQQRKCSQSFWPQVSILYTLVAFPFPRGERASKREFLRHTAVFHPGFGRGNPQRGPVRLSAPARPYPIAALPVQMRLPEP